MADIAVTDEIAHLVGFLIVGEIAKATDMVNVQLSTQLFFRNTAALASVVISPAGSAALLSPVLSVVRKIAALPVEVVLTGTTRCEHYAITLSAACLSLRKVAGFSQELLTTDDTGFGYWWRQVLGASRLDAELGILLTFRRVFFEPIVVARLAAETTAVRTRLILVRFAALFAGSLNRWIGLPMGDVVYRGFAGTNTRTILARPTLEVLKDLAASRACGCGALIWIVEGFAALKRASRNPPRLVIRDFLAANGAVDCDVVFGLPWWGQCGLLCNVSDMSHVIIPHVYRR